jgi:hypothetical protein
MEATMALRRFIIERDIPKVGTFEREQLRAAAAKSNETLQQLGPDIQWLESFVADNKTFCVYLAKDEAIAVVVTGRRSARCLARSCSRCSTASRFLPKVARSGCRWNFSAPCPMP